MKCRSTFVRRDLLLRHDRTVHAKDGGVPLHSDGKRRGGGVTKARAVSGPSKSSIAAIDTAAIEQLEASSEGIFDVETAAMLVADLHHKATAAVRASGSPYESPSGIPPFSQNASSLMEPAVTYPSGAIAIPQWDNFMAQPVDSKPHSIASSTSGTYEAQAFAAVNANQNLEAPLPSLGGHNVHGESLFFSFSSVCPQSFLVLTRSQTPLLPSPSISRSVRTRQSNPPQPLPASRCRRSTAMTSAT